MTTLRVFLRAHGRLELSDGSRAKASLWLEPIAKARARFDARILLSRRPDDPTGALEADVKPGLYRIHGRPPSRLERAGWRVPTVAVRVRDQRQRVQIQLVKRGWHSVPVGDGFLALDPATTRLALVFEHAPPSAKARARLTKELADLGWVVSVPRSEKPKGHERPSGPEGESASVFVLEGPASFERARALELRLRVLLPKSLTRIGLLAGPPAVGVVLLDRHYVARFASEVPAEARRQWIQEVGSKLGANYLQTVETHGGSSGENRYLYDRFELTQGELVDHLDLVDELRRRDEVLWVEPDIIQSLRAAGAAFPDDPLQVAASLSPNRGQFTLKLQAFPEAWNLLGPASRSGNSNINVAILDEGFSTPVGQKMPHEDAPAAQIVGFHDFYQAPLAADAMTHGNRMWGILGATADNTKHITGLAPKASIVLAVRPSFQGDVYRKVLLWLGGLADTGGNQALQPGILANPNPYPARVVCCAHALAPSGFAPAAFSAAAARLAADGGSGKGTLLVYAAGNQNRPVEEGNALAADPSTFAVGNCTYSSIERLISRLSDSNYGEALDLSALGDQAMTLQGTHGSGWWNINDVAGGTSAACATVAGAAVLLLADQPAATCAQLRSALERGALDVTLFNAAPQKLPLPIPALPTAAATLTKTSDFGHGLLNVERALLLLRGSSLALAVPAAPVLSNLPYQPAISQGGSTMAAPLTSPGQVRIAAGITGDKVHEKELDPAIANPNWSFDGATAHTGDSHESWVKGLFSNNPGHVQQALDGLGLSAADRQKVQAALSAIDRTVALTVYKKLKQHIADEVKEAVEKATGNASGNAGQHGHTY